MLDQATETALLWPWSAAAADPVKVRVLDRECRVIEEIASPRQLASFIELWSKRIEQTSQNSAATGDRYPYKLDIQYSRRTERWLYDPTGFTRVLSKQRAPVYRIPSPQEFNALLRIASE